MSVLVLLLKKLVATFTPKEKSNEFHQAARLLQDRAFECDRVLHGVSLRENRHQILLSIDGL